MTKSPGQLFRGKRPHLLPHFIKSIIWACLSPVYRKRLYVLILGSCDRITFFSSVRTNLHTLLCKSKASNELRLLYHNFGSNKRKRKKRGDQAKRDERNSEIYSHNPCVPQCKIRPMIYSRS